MAIGYLDTGGVPEGGCVVVLVVGLWWMVDGGWLIVVGAVVVLCQVAAGRFILLQT